MKVLNTMKKNWNDYKIREEEKKRLKEIEDAKKDLKLSEEDIKEIIKLIGEQNPAWAQLDPDLMSLFFTLALKQFKPKEEDFDLTDKAKFRQSIADIFNGSNDKVKFNLNNSIFRPNEISPAQIKQLNDAYAKGKNTGSGFKKALKSMFKKQTKNI